MQGLDEEKQLTLFQFNLYDEKGHLVPLDSELIEKGKKIRFSGRVQVTARPKFYDARTVHRQTVNCRTVRCRTVHCWTVHCWTVHRWTVHRRTVHCWTVHRRTVRRWTVHCRKVRRRTVRHRKVRRRIVRRRTVCCRTVHYWMVHHYTMFIAIFYPLPILGNSNEQGSVKNCTAMNCQSAVCYSQGSICSASSCKIIDSHNS